PGHAFQQHGHQPGGHLVVWNLAARVAGNQELDLFAGQFPGVAFAADEVNNAHAGGWSGCGSLASQPSRVNAPNRAGRAAEFLPIQAPTKSVAAGRRARAGPRLTRVGERFEDAKPRSKPLSCKEPVAVVPPEPRKQRNAPRAHAGPFQKLENKISWQNALGHR